MTRSLMLMAFAAVAIASGCGPAAAPPRAATVGSPPATTTAAGVPAPPLLAAPAASGAPAAPAARGLLPEDGPQFWQIPGEVVFDGPPLPAGVADGIALYQPYLDQYSWRVFIAVNWPACRPSDSGGGCAPGDPDKGRWLGAGGDAPTVWEQWMNASDVFRDGGAVPIDWGTSRVPAQCQSLAAELHSPVFTLTDGSATSHNKPALDGYLQFDRRATGPLIDQQRRWARIESYMNRPVYDYIVKSKLFSKAGQAEFTKKGLKVDFPPANSPIETAARSVEIKVVWRILADANEGRRYHTARGVFVDKGGKCSVVTVGMAAMHIMTKTPDSRARVWSTFEHVDNLCRSVANKDGKGYSLQSGAFCSADCATHPSKPGCAANVAPPESQWTPPDPPTAPGKVPPTQVTRVDPLPAGSYQINSLMSSFLGSISKDSVWQNYELVSTQWVMPLVADLNQSALREELNIPNSGPAPQYYTPLGSAFKDSDLSEYNKLGLIVPPFLANTLVETYNQKGASCLGCHQKAKMTDKSSADFSWVLTRAK